MHLYSPDFSGDSLDHADFQLEIQSTLLRDPPADPREAVSVDFQAYQPPTATDICMYIYIY